MKLNKTIFFHVFGALLFLSIPLLFPTYTREFIMKEFSSYVLGLIFFYINFYYLVPKFYFQQRYGIYILVLIGSFVLITFLPLFILYQQQSNDVISWEKTHKVGGFFSPYYSDIKRTIILFAASVFASIAFRISDHLVKLNKEKVNAELSYLKAQINPHFLFNTLNSIYSLAIVKSDNAAISIVKLSGMMRYVLSETSEKFVLLEKEMAYINNYIDLQKMRLGETALVNYAYNGDFSNKKIAPLILIPFIENAFKHGVNPEAPSQIDIQISVSETTIYLHVFNLKVPHRYSKEDYSGIGMENGKNQLALLYPNKHQLKIDDTNFSFTVNLNIQIL